MNDATLETVRQTFPNWTVREKPFPSATRRHQLTQDQIYYGMDMTIWADSLTQLARRLARQEALATP